MKKSRAERAAAKRRFVRELKAAAGARWRIDCMPVAEAWDDPRLGAGTQQLVTEAALSFLADGPNRECFSCMQRWSHDRVLVVVMWAEFLNGSEKGLMAGICADCADSGRLTELVLAGLQRDIGFDRNSVQTIHAAPAGLV